MADEQKFNPLVQYFLLDKYWRQYLIIFGLILLISTLFPHGKALKYSYQVNDITREPIIAPFTFSILKSEERLQKDLDERKKLVPNFFNGNDETVESQKDAWGKFLALPNKLGLAIGGLEESKG